MTRRLSKAFQQMPQVVSIHRALCSRHPWEAQHLSKFSLSHCYRMAKFRFLPSLVLLPWLAFSIIPSPKLGQQISSEMRAGRLVFGGVESNGMSSWLQVLGTTFFLVACLLYKPPPTESAPGSSGASENGNSDLQEHKPSLPAEEHI